MVPRHRAGSRDPSDVTRNSALTRNSASRSMCPRARPKQQEQIGSALSMCLWWSRAGHDPLGARRDHPPDERCAARCRWTDGLSESVFIDGPRVQGHSSARRDSMQATLITRARPRHPGRTYIQSAVQLSGMKTGTQGSPETRLGTCPQHTHAATQLPNVVERPDPPCSHNPICVPQTPTTAAFRRRAADGCDMAEVRPLSDSILR